MSGILGDLFGGDTETDEPAQPEPATDGPESDDYPRDVETVAEELDRVEAAVERLREKREALQREREAAERARRFDFGLHGNLGYRDEHLDALHGCLEELEARGHLTADEFDRLYSDYFSGAVRHVPTTPHIARDAAFLTHPSVAVETAGRWHLTEPVDAGDVVETLSYSVDTKRGEDRVESVVVACEAIDRRPRCSLKHVAVAMDRECGRRLSKRHYHGDFEDDLRAIEAVEPPTDGAPAWLWTGDDSADGDESRPKYDTGQADGEGPAYGVDY